MFVNVFNFAYPDEDHLDILELLPLFFQQTTVYLSFILLFFFFLTILLVKLSTSSNKFSSLFGYIKIFNILILTLIFTLTIVKFMLYLLNFKIYSFYKSSFE